MISIFKNDFANSHAESWLLSKFHVMDDNSKWIIDFDGQPTPVWESQKKLSSLIWDLVFLNERHPEFEERWHYITTSILYACPWA